MRSNACFISENAMSDAENLSIPPVVLSIRPTYVSRILNGAKRVELRRRFPTTESAPRTVLIYSTAPVQSIVAIAQLAAVEIFSLAKLWRQRGNDAGVSKEEFDAYFDGVEQGCALVLQDVKKLKNPVHLTDLARRFDFTPPQSYCYWKTSLQELTTHGRVKAATRY